MEKLCQSMPSRALDCTMVSVPLPACSEPVPVTTTPPAGNVPGATCAYTGPALHTMAAVPSTTASRRRSRPEMRGQRSHRRQAAMRRATRSRRVPRAARAAARDGLAARAAPAGGRCACSRRAVGAVWGLACGLMADSGAGSAVVRVSPLIKA